MVSRFLLIASPIHWIKAGDLSNVSLFFYSAHTTIRKFLNEKLRKKNENEWKKNNGAPTREEKKIHSGEHFNHMQIRCQSSIWISE